MRIPTMMNIGFVTSMLLAVAAAGCGSDSPSAPGSTRVTETLSATTTLLSDGSIDYPSGVFPRIVVGQAGQVDVTATFTPTSGCRFILTLCRTGCLASDLQSAAGPGPTLSASGALAPNTYQVLMSARMGGVSLCTSVPAGGVPFTYTVTATHP